MARKNVSKTTYFLPYGMFSSNSNVPVDTKIGHFGDVLPNQSLRLVLKKLNLTQQNQIFTGKRKVTTSQNKHGLETEYVPILTGPWQAWGCF